MTREEINEPDSLNAKYVRLLTHLKEKQATLTLENIEELIKESNVLFDQIRKPSTLKIDAQIMSHTTKFSNCYLSKLLRNTKLNVQIFLQIIKNNDYRFFYECNKKYNKGVSFCKFLSLECEDKKLSSRSVTSKSIVDTEPEIPKPLEDQKNEEFSLTDKIQKIVKEQKKINFFRLVIDPVSYSKTVENIFYTAFAVRLGNVSLAVEDAELFVLHTNYKSDTAGHLIFDISHDEYKEMIQKYNITKSML